MTKGMYDSSNETGEDVTPEVAGVYSNTFHDDRIGVSANFSYQRRDFQRQSANIRSWQLNPNLSDSAVVTDGRAQDVDGNVIEQFMAPNEAGVLESTSAAFFPQEISFARDDIQRERLNSNITLQFAATDRLTYTLDHTTSKARPLPYLGSLASSLDSPNLLTPSTNSVTTMQC